MLSIRLSVQIIGFVEFGFLDLHFDFFSRNGAANRVFVGIGGGG